MQHFKTKGKSIQFTTIQNTGNTETHFGKLASETYLSQLILIEVKCISTVKHANLSISHENMKPKFQAYQKIGCHFFSKIKHSAFLFKIIFLKKKITQLYKFIKHSFQFGIKNPEVCLQEHLKLIMSDGHSYISHSILLLCGQRWWLYQTSFPSNRKVFQGKSLI